MRTTLKRGMGRGAAVNGNGRAVLPPSPHSPVAYYRQPPPARRSGLQLVATGFLWLVAAVIVVAAGLVGGAYVYGHEVVADIQAHSPEVKQAQERLDNIPAPGRPAIALVIGYDKRGGIEKAFEARSDTIMLVRADPDTKALSLLSFPRDLIVDVRCPGKQSYRGRINEAYANCDAKGTLETVRGLIGLPINYLITVNFRGFKQVVAKVGGVWIDVDRRYFNDNSGCCDRYATIDLQPGYQKLNGQNALDFVRYRHTDSDLYRVARQQLFVSAFREAIKSGFGLSRLRKIVGVITDNVEVGVGGGKALSLGTLLSYAKFVYQLPPGHVFQAKIEGLSGYAELSTDSSNVEAAVREFAYPDVEAPEKATDVALGRKPRAKTGPPPRDVTLAVLNGNGVPGAAATAGYALGKAGYQIVLPASGNAPSFDYFNTKVYYDKKTDNAALAARKVANLFGDAEVEPMPLEIRRLAAGAMEAVVVGQTYTGSIAAAPVDRTPKREPPLVRADPDATIPLLREVRRRAGFPLLVPTVLQRTSYPVRSTPVRVYDVAGHRAVRLVFDTGANEYWGIQMTTWADAPAIDDPSETVRIKGRKYQLFYAGEKLHMVVIRQNGATYWVINTLLNTLSNETMLAIAKGLKPLRNG